MIPTLTITSFTLTVKEDVICEPRLCRYWHIAVVTSLYVYCGVIPYPLHLLLAMVPNRAEYCLHVCLTVTFTN